MVKAEQLPEGWEAKKIARLTQIRSICKARRIQAQKSAIGVRASHLVAQVYHVLDKEHLEELEVLEQDLATCREKMAGLQELKKAKEDVKNLEKSLRKLKVRRLTLQEGQ
jgi:hypothetical protein